MMIINLHDYSAGLTIKFLLTIREFVFIGLVLFLLNI